MFLPVKIRFPVRGHDPAIGLTLDQFFLFELSQGHAQGLIFDRKLLSDGLSGERLGSGGQELEDRVVQWVSSLF